MKPTSKPNYQALQQAAKWFATLNDEGVTEADKSRWQIWLNGHPEHQQAWRYVEGVGERFKKAQHQAGPEGVANILSASRNHFTDETLNHKAIEIAAARGYDLVSREFVLYVRSKSSKT